MRYIIPGLLAFSFIISIILSSCARPELVCECRFPQLGGQYTKYIGRKAKTSWADAVKDCHYYDSTSWGKYDTCFVKEIR